MTACPQQLSDSTFCSTSGEVNWASFTWDSPSSLSFSWTPSLPRVNTRWYRDRENKVRDDCGVRRHLQTTLDNILDASVPKEPCKDTGIKVFQTFPVERVAGVIVQMKFTLGNTPSNFL